MNQFKAILTALALLLTIHTSAQLQEVDRTEYTVIAESDRSIIYGSLAKVCDKYFLCIKTSKRLGYSGATSNYITLETTSGTYQLTEDRGFVKRGQAAESFYELPEGMLEATEVLRIRVRMSKDWIQGEWSNEQSWSAYLQTLGTNELD